MTITNNAGNATSLTWTAPNNAAFTRIMDRIDAEYAGKNPDGSDRNLGQRVKALIRGEIFQPIRERSKRRLVLRAMSSVADDPEGAES